MVKKLVKSARTAKKSAHASAAKKKVAKSIAPSRKAKAHKPVAKSVKSGKTARPVAKSKPAISAKPAALKTKKTVKPVVKATASKKDQQKSLSKAAKVLSKAVISREKENAGPAKSKDSGNNKKATAVIPVKPLQKEKTLLANPPATELEKPAIALKVDSKPAAEVKPPVEKKPEKPARDLAKILKSGPLRGRDFISEILKPVGPVNAIQPEDKPFNIEMQKELSETKKSSGDGEKKGSSTEDKLRALYDLQLIDTRIDKIRAVRGELPLEVQDLEDEIAGLTTRIKNHREELENIDKEISGKKIAIKDAESMIKKYKEQQAKVRNNREFDSLTKETEYQELEIQLHKKKIKEYEALKEAKTELINSAETKLAERGNDLKVKKAELDEIIAETEKEEKFLQKKSEEAERVIESRLLLAYRRIREASRNGLAVVPIEREASAGSFITIPPQKQLDVAARKKIIVDEHSGRILVDADLAREETDRIEGLLAQELGR